VLQEFKLENLTVGEREVGCSPVIREFEFVFLTVENPYRNGRRERISSSEAMIYQWTSLGLGFMVKKDNVPRPYITNSSAQRFSRLSIVHHARWSVHTNTCPTWNEKCDAASAVCARRHDGRHQEQHQSMVG
jgi:hypothetical protein